MNWRSTEPSASSMSKKKLPLTNSARADETEPELEFVSSLTPPPRATRLATRTRSVDSADWNAHVTCDARARARAMTRQRRRRCWTRPWACRFGYSCAR
eukprot:3519860-Pleurochrysis_carterae.AAC.1